MTIADFGPTARMLGSTEDRMMEEWKSVLQLFQDLVIGPDVYYYHSEIMGKIAVLMLESPWLRNGGGAGH